MLKIQYKSDEHIWEYYMPDLRCPCGANVFHKEYDGSIIRCVCNSCSEVLANVKEMYIQSELNEGIWKDVDIPNNDKKMTNYEYIKNMNIEEMAEFIKSMVDESGSHNVGCYGCIDYGTHHSDVSNKGTNLYSCEHCENEGVGLDIVKWLERER